MQIGKGRTLKGLLLQMKLGQTSEERILAEECIEIAFDELLKALNDIAALEGKTLLGKCCPSESCSDKPCPHQLGAVHAFGQAAEIAKSVIPMGKQ
jgi:hypothetical protein